MSNQTQDPKQALAAKKAAVDAVQQAAQKPQVDMSALQEQINQMVQQAVAQALAGISAAPVQEPPPTPEPPQEPPQKLVSGDLETLVAQLREAGYNVRKTRTPKGETDQSWLIKPSVKQLSGNGTFRLTNANGTFSTCQLKAGKVSVKDWNAMLVGAGINAHKSALAVEILTAKKTAATWKRDDNGNVVMDDNGDVVKVPGTGGKAYAVVSKGVMGDIRPGVVSATKNIRAYTLEFQPEK